MDIKGYVGLDKIVIGDFNIFFVLGWSKWERFKVEFYYRYI